ncbi:MAG: hypothetical protein FWC41_00600 [Firmicutes bacterium]|nr:hypothetical protein [Bacillota bacterium]
MIHGILQKGWKMLESVFPDANQVLDKAKEIGESEKSVPAVLNFLEGVAKQKGASGALDNQIWNSLKNIKSVNEVIPHVENLIKQPEIAKLLPNILFSNNKNDN